MTEIQLTRDAFEYDVFLSHASEDKDEVARPLAVALRQRGLRVWYDETEMKIGDDLVEKINAGIANSRFGILVLSKTFFAKSWTEWELNILENLAVTENRVNFPIWHSITLGEVRRLRPSLARAVARSTATHTIDQIADEIAQIVTGFEDQREIPDEP